MVAPSDAGRAARTRSDGVPVRRVRYAPAPAETLAYRGTMAVGPPRTPAGSRALAGLWRALRRAAARRAAAGADLVHAHWWVPAGLAAPRGRADACSPCTAPTPRCSAGSAIRAAAGPAGLPARHGGDRGLARAGGLGAGGTGRHVEPEHVQPMPVDTDAVSAGARAAGGAVVRGPAHRPEAGRPRHRGGRLPRHARRGRAAAHHRRGRARARRPRAAGQPSWASCRSRALRRRRAAGRHPAILAGADLMFFPAQGRGVRARRGGGADGRRAGGRLLGRRRRARHRACDRRRPPGAPVGATRSPTRRSTCSPTPTGWPRAALSSARRGAARLAPGPGGRAVRGMVSRGAGCGNRVARSGARRSGSRARHRRLRGAAADRGTGSDIARPAARYGRCAGCCSRPARSASGDVRAAGPGVARDACGLGRPARPLWTRPGSGPSRASGSTSPARSGRSPAWRSWRSGPASSRGRRRRRR